jgi:hypothetical protein
MASSMLHCAVQCTGPCTVTIRHGVLCGDGAQGMPFHSGTAPQIEDGDVIATFAYSAVVAELLLHAHQADGRRFQVRCTLGCTGVSPEAFLLLLLLQEMEVSIDKAV